MGSSSRIALIVFAVVAALVASASFFLSSSDTPPPGASFASDAVEPARAQVETARVEFETDPHGDSAVDDEFDSAGDRTAVDSAVGAKPDGPALRVRVIAADTNAPVAHAEVFWAAFGDNRERGTFGDLPILGGRFGLGTRHIAIGLIADGQKRIVDDRGETTLPPMTWRTAVVARDKGRIGYAELERGRGDELVVALLPDETLSVRVVDFAGQAAVKAPVVVAQIGGRQGGEAIWSGETDAAGFARMPHFRLHVREGLQPKFAAALRVPLPKPEYREFTGDPPPSEPIELTMPATGRIEVTVLDRNALPIESALRVWVRPVREKGAQVIPIPMWFEMSMGTKEHGENTVLLGPVGLGMQWVAGARLAERGRGDRFEGPAFFGPRGDGDLSRVTLAAPDWLALVRGRIVDAAGAPRASARIPFQVRDGTRGLLDEEMQLDADGHFELIVRIDREVTQPASLEVVERLEDGVRAAGLAMLPNLAPGARVEIGELRLVETPPLARGRVIDDLGAPIRGARVQLQVSTDGKRYFDGGLARDRGREDGRFIVFGIPPAGAMRLRVTADGHATEVVPLLGMGATLEVVLQRTVNLRVVVRVPEGVPQQALKAELRNSNGQNREFDLQARRGVAGFEVNDIERGSYDLAITMRNFVGDLRALRGLQLHPDMRREDRRIEIDLNDSIHSYAVELIGAGGAIDEQARGVLAVQAIGPDGLPVWQAFQIQKGKAVFVAPQSMLEARVFPEGRAQVNETLRAGTTRLFTSPTNPVELELAGLRALVGEARVRVSLVLLADTGLPPGMRGVDQASGSAFSLERASLGKSGGAWLGADDRVRVPVARNGRYQVVVRIHGASRRGPESRVMAEIDVVVDGGQPTRVSVPVDTVELAKALEASKRR